MAILTRIICQECQHLVDVMHPPHKRAPQICRSCQSIIDQRKRQDHLCDLSMLPIEERLRRIEEWIYDYKPPVRIEDIRF